PEMELPHHVHADIPSSWLVRWAPLIPPAGEVLDLACGGGRHARFLAQQGHVVDAVDRDAEALALLALAQQGHVVDAVDRDAQALALLAGVAGVRPLRADLEGGPWPYPDRAWDGIVVANYLHRPLFPSLLASLRPGGVLIYETFMAGNERWGRPTNPAFLLQPNELLTAFGADLALAAFEQGEVGQPKPAVVQRICAVRTADVTRVRLPGSAAPAV
ncbi:MAG: methyltransferase type 12, partial [Proteobacteria bacterium]|nr:methyltransferase type 12 [Pseudomonadota bacterium]